MFPDDVPPLLRNLVSLALSARYFRAVVEVLALVADRVDEAVLADAVQPVLVEDSDVDAYQMMASLLSDVGADRSYADLILRMRESCDEAVVQLARQLAEEGRERRS